MFLLSTKIKINENRLRKKDQNKMDDEYKLTKQIGSIFILLILFGILKFRDNDNTIESHPTQF